MSQRGFTLLELLVVMAIVATIAVLALPQLGKALPGVELSAAARSLAAHLKSARQHAIVTNRTTRFVLDLAARQYSTVGTGGPTTLNDGVAVAFMTAQRNRVGAAGGSIDFFPDGSASGGEIALSQGSRRFRISVHWLTGRIVVAEGAPDA